MYQTYLMNKSWHLSRDRMSGSERPGSCGRSSLSSPPYARSWSSWNFIGGKRRAYCFQNGQLICSLCSKDKIMWECDNGGQLYSASVAAGYHASTAFPSQFCTTGFSSFLTAWIIALSVDLMFQVRMLYHFMYRSKSHSPFSYICTSWLGGIVKDWSTIQVWRSVTKVRAWLKSDTSP